MSIASEITRLQQAKADIKTAIENKGVTVPSDATLDDYDGYIYDIPSGGGGTSLEDKPVIYIDYDGSVVYGYTAEEFAQLTEHPANPDHSGDDIPLTSQGWNWTLSDAQTYVAANGYLVIGQMYITTDGATYIGIDTTKSANDKFTNGGISVNFSQDLSNGISFDFGDGTTPQTVSGSNAKSISHTYAADGQYVIKITPISGNIGLNYSFWGNWNSNDILLLYDAVTFIRIGHLDVTTLNVIGRNNLETITIPHGVQQLSQISFQCSKCIGITVPDSVTTLGADCMSHSKELKYVSIPNSLTTINNSAFARCEKIKLLTLPNAMTKIGAQVFQNCFSLERVIMPTTLTTIGSSWFNSCYNLQYVNIPTNLTSCPSFNTCVRLKTLTLPSGLTTIDTGAFQACYNLETCNIPSTVDTIGASAFRYPNNLRSVTIPSKVTKLNGTTFQGCNTLEQLTLSDNITEFGQYEFANCYNLKTLTLPSKLITIGQYAFSYCYLLKNIVIPNNVTTINQYAFSYCTSVETITIGEKVTTMGNQVFTAQYRERDTLQAIYMLPLTPPTITSSTFYQLGSAFTIYVPNGKLTAYQTASNWIAFASQMVEMPAS